MTKSELVTILRSQKLAVEASISRDSAPQAAVVGFGVSDDLEIIFDTLVSTRKCQNLRENPRIAIVIGWGEWTAQLEGNADFPTGEDLVRLKRVYFEAYPDGPTREAWEGITYVRVRPTWARFSDFGAARRVVEIDCTAPAT